ncbi:general substrate transporter [Mycena latifolia]|nr:general substrate transporter [Mycena latifolia]
MAEKDSSGTTELSVVQVDEPAPLHKVQNVLNADLALALSTGPQLKPCSVQTFKLYLVLLVSFMGSLAFGFSTTVIGGVNGMVQFTDYFGIGGGDTGGGQGIMTAMLYSIFPFGCIAGSFVAGSAADQWGRRGGMFLASLMILAGVSTVTAAQSRIYLFFGRFFIGFGAMINHSAGPAYVAEIAPPQWRGRLAGLYNTFTYVGSIICAGLVIATGRINSSLSWRLPFAVQFVPTIILAVGVWFIPESPRWLMSVGRKDEAHRILAKYHGNGDANSPLVLLECRELETRIKVAGSDKRWWDYSELFNSRGARYRIFIISWLGACGQLSGGGIFYYTTVVFYMAGVKTQEERLTFTFISESLAAFGALVGASIVDRIGRRALWLWGTVFAAVSLALGARFTAKAESSAAIAFILISNTVLSMTFMPLQGVYPSECLNFSARSKGLALYALVINLGSLANSFAGAVAFQKIGWKYMLVPAAWDVVEVVVVWFCAVETKGRTLEELDEIFEDRHPVYASLNKDRGSRGVAE